MSRFVPVLLGVDSAQYAVGVEQGAQYVIIGPDGTRAAFNNREDLDHVGFLTDPPSGLDSPDVRESADLIIEGDGGIHGAFYFGRRPVTMTGLIDPNPGPNDYDTIGDPATAWGAGRVANRRINRLQRATRALRADAALVWTPLDAPEVQLLVRRQNPLRITDRLPKRFLISLVSADPRIYGTIVKTDAQPTTCTCVNNGNAGMSPVVILTGAWGNTPSITNQATGEVLNFAALGMASAGDILTVDFDAGTAILNGNNVYGKVAFLTSTWWQIQPGSNTVIAAGGAGTRSIQVNYSDAWL